MQNPEAYIEGAPEAAPDKTGTATLRGPAAQALTAGGCKPGEEITVTAKCRVGAAAPDGAVELEVMDLDYTGGGGEAVPDEPDGAGAFDNYQAAKLAAATAD